MKPVIKNSLVGASVGVVVGVGVSATKIVRETNKLVAIELEEVERLVNLDEMESVYAIDDPAEKGLTQLDSIHRYEWQANGFPQTHREMKELENQ